MMHEFLIARLHTAANTMNDCAPGYVPTAALMEEAATALSAVPAPPASVRIYCIPQSVLLDAITEGLTLDHNIVVKVDNSGVLSVDLPASVNRVLERIYPQPVSADITIIR